MSRCPLQGVYNNSPCDKEDCAWWNERFTRCSIFVIGDRIDDLAITLEQKEEPDANIS